MERERAVGCYWSSTSSTNKLLLTCPDGCWTARNTQGWDQLADSIRGGQLYGPGRGGMDSAEGGVAQGEQKMGNWCMGTFYILTLATTPCSTLPVPIHLHDSIQFVLILEFSVFFSIILAWKMVAILHLMYYKMKCFIIISWHIRNVALHFRI